MKATPKTDFKRLHTFLADLYGIPAINLSLEDDLRAIYDEVKAKYTAAAKKVHERKGFSAADMDTPEVRKLTESTYRALSKAIDTTISQRVSESTRRALEHNTFVFSGMKAYTSLREAGSLDFTDKDGKPKSWHAFKKEADALNVKYNEHYLHTEYQFATRSAENVNKWEQIEQNSDRFNLQYRTAGDDKVRDDHQALEGTTLPASDPFWDQYYPPNGWNCRCVAVEVRKSKYPESDSEEAIAKGRRGTTQIGKDGTNKAEIFRFNPGKDKKIFPDKHPYTSGDCGKLKAIWRYLSTAEQINLEEKADKCKAKKEVEEISRSFLRKKKDSEIATWTKENIHPNAPIVEHKNFSTGNVQITRKYVKDFASHFADPELKEMAKDILTIVKQAEYIETKPLSKESPNYENKVKRGVTAYSYYHFEWKERVWRLNVEVINNQYEKPYSANELIKKE